MIIAEEYETARKLISNLPEGEGVRETNFEEKLPVLTDVNCWLPVFT
jgi:hypothetical protein